MNRFEQLIEYVINDEEAKAKELFHDIVVEKSRQIYENLMSEETEEELDEAEEEIEEGAECADDEEEIEEGAIGGDAADDLIDDVEMEEESDINMEGDDEAEVEFDDEAEADGEDLTHDIEGGSDETATKDDILNLEDKLDQLMAEFESLMGDGDIEGNGDGFGPDEGGDAIEMDDTEEMDEVGMMEAVSLKAAPKPVTSEEGGTNTKSTVSANSGATGMAGKPVSSGAEQGGRHDAPGAYSNTTKDLISDFQNKAGAGMKDQKPATKPHLAQATGVNTKSPLPKG